MRRSTEHDLQQVRETNKRDLLPTYGKFCLRCGYEWLPRVRDPKRCPDCRSYRWATERTNRQGLRPNS